MSGRPTTSDAVDMRIVDVAPQAAGIVSISLSTHDGSPAPPWAPGAHVEVTLPSGKIRHYSLCGDTSDSSTLEIAVLREENGRGGSVELHDIAEVGVSLPIRFPRNNFELVDGTEYLFIAGGVGVTPILPMIAHVAASGASWSLLYGGRSRSSMAFVDRLSDYGSDNIRIVPQDTEGFLPLREALEYVPPGCEIYCCGPAGLLDAVTEMSAEFAPSARVHIERFGADPNAAPNDNGSAFDVELARTGITVSVAADQSILRAIEGVCPDVAFSCEDGYCGSCETGVLAGVPDHRDTFLTDDERSDNDVMMICVSRAQGGRIKLDL